MAGTNPAQQEIIDRLGTPRDDRPSYDAELRHQLRWFLEAGPADALAELPAHRSIYISTAKLARVPARDPRSLHHDCA